MPAAIWVAVALVLVWLALGVSVRFLRSAHRFGGGDLVALRLFRSLRVFGGGVRWRGRLVLRGGCCFGLGGLGLGRLVL